MWTSEYKFGTMMAKKLAEKVQRKPVQLLLFPHNYHMICPGIA